MTGDINIFWLLGILVPVFLFGVAVGRAIEVRDMRRHYESLRLFEGSKDRPHHDRDP